MKNPKKTKILLTAALLVVLTTAVIAVGCSEEGLPEETTASEETTAPVETEPDTTEEETTAPEETTQPEEDTTEEETTAEEDPVIIENSGKYGYNLNGQVINPLTGEKGTAEMVTKRPVAIMINNISVSMPQMGISKADVLYECMVEGGITRLMAVVLDYENLGVIGSIRSSREYYLDLAANHGAIYVHAGGSDQAYREIHARHIDYIDGVNHPAPNMYYYDQERRKSMSLEHTLMTTGEKIAAGIDYFKYDKTIDPEIKGMFHFISYNSEAYTPKDGEAPHVIVPYTSYHFPQYIYDAGTKLYSRYQYKGQEHIDGETGEILQFKNILILCCTHTNTNDEKNHIDVDPVGEGEGYYISNGGYRKIRWVKSTNDSVMVLYDSEGNELQMNVGKTMVNVVSPAVMSGLKFNGLN